MNSDDGHTWVVSVQCGNGGICAEHVVCQEQGESGLMHDVYMDGVDVGDVCVPNRHVDAPNVARLATRAFKRYDWPGSTVTVQPKGNRTLVNFETIFYTDNSQPTTRVVELAGRQVTIEATPVSYAWDFGDGSEETTQSPGHPHPNADVTHVYETADPVSASVATTYSGRFRIGDGEWQVIDETRTIPGLPVDLEVLEAKPQLVNR